VHDTTARVELKNDALQEYLRRNGLTYAELSRKAGINRSNLVHSEDCEGRPR